MELKVIRMDERVTHLAISGKLDINTVMAGEPDFWAHTVGRQKPALVDIAGVTFLGSMGIRMLLNAFLTLKDKGVPLILLNPPPLIEKTFKHAGLLDLLAIERDERQALEKLGAG